MTSDPKTSSRTGRFKVFLTGTVVGLFIFAVSQTIVGNLVSDWLKQTLHPKSPQVRLRYFVLDIGEAAPPIQPEVLQKLFKGSSVYMQENAVTELLRFIYSSPVVVAGDPVGRHRYRDAQQYLEAVEADAAELVKQESGWSQQSGPIYHYYRRSSCARLLRDDLFEENLARAIALANKGRTDVFFTILTDLREECGSYDGPPPYFEEKVYLASLKLLSLDIENVGAALPGPLSVGVNVYGTNNSPLTLSPLPQAESSSPDRQVVWSTPFDTFMPGEHLLIPLAVLLEPVASRSYIDLRGKLLWEDSWGTPDDQKTTRWYESRNPPNQRFLRLGPGYEVNYVDGTGQREKVRPFTGSTLVYAAVDGAETGSCPLIVAYQHETGTVVKTQRVLVGATGTSKKRREIHQIPGPVSVVELLEDEPEISYIDLFVVRGRTRDGRVLTCITTDERLQQEDNQYLILRKGEFIRVSCDQQMTSLELTVSGYYEPLGVPAQGNAANTAASADHKAPLPGR